MVDLESTDRKIAKIDGSLGSLETTIFNTTGKVQAFGKGFLDAANSLNGAGKKWTIFSRIVSGTPLWRFQNYLRAALSTFSEFGESARKAQEVLQEQNKVVVENLKNYDKLKENVDNANRAVDKFIKNKTLDPEETKVLKDQVKELDIYTIALKQTGDETKALIRTRSMLNKQAETARKENEETLKVLRKQYAFDKDRIEVAKEQAKIEAQAQGKGRFKQFFVKRKAEKDEKKQMKKDQKGVLKESRKEAGKSALGMTFNLKQFKALMMPLAPIAGILKVAKDRKKLATKASDFTKSLAPLLNQAFKFFLFTMMAVVVFLLFVKAAYEIFQFLQEMGIVDEVKAFAGEVFSLVGSIFKVIGTFIDGDYQKAFALLGPILEKAVDLGIKGAKLLVKLAFMTLVGGFNLIIRFFEAFVGDPAFRERVISYGLIILKIALGAWMLKTIAISLLTLAGMYALPILFVIAMAALLYALADRFDEKFKQGLIALKDGILEGLRDALLFAGDYVGEYIVKLYDKIRDFFGTHLDKVFKVKDVVSKGGEFLFKGGKFIGEKSFDFASDVKGAMAKGGTTSLAGNYLVGERGAEIVELPAGARVHNNSETNKLLSTPSNTVNNTHNNNITVNVEAKGNSDAELRMLADKIGKLVAGNINRRVSSSSSIVR
tara:strand:+ start:601 stop:2583 length:1983 start_codon:yes stop_codon:yes gene_type:complete